MKAMRNLFVISLLVFLSLTVGHEFMGKTLTLYWYVVLMGVSVLVMLGIALKFAEKSWHGKSLLPSFLEPDKRYPARAFTGMGPGHIMITEYGGERDHSWRDLECSPKLHPDTTHIYLRITPSVSPRSVGTNNAEIVQVCVRGEQVLS